MIVLEKRENETSYIGMSTVEQRLIELIRESDDPEKALVITVEVITDFLRQLRSSEEQAADWQGLCGTNQAVAHGNYYPKNCRWTTMAEQLKNPQQLIKKLAVAATTASFNGGK